jgi:hypothetical protein
MLIYAALALMNIVLDPPIPIPLYSIAACLELPGLSSERIPKWIRANDLKFEIGHEPNSSNHPRQIWLIQGME